MRLARWEPFSVVIFLLVFLSSCKRPQEPENNAIEVGLYQFDFKNWNSYPESFDLQLHIKAHFHSLSGPDFHITKPNHPFFAGIAQFNKSSWQINYQDITDLEKSIDRRLEVSSKAIDSKILAQNLKPTLDTRNIDLDDIPFSVPVHLILQDNPSETRDVAHATGAAIWIPIKRVVIEKPSADLPKEGSLTYLAEYWWIAEKTTYTRYRDLLKCATFLLNYVLNISDTRNIVLRERMAFEQIYKIKTEAEILEKQIARHRLKKRLIAAFKLNPKKFDPQKLSTYWDDDQSKDKAEFIINYGNSLLQLNNGSMGDQFFKTRHGEKVSEALEAELIVDAKKLANAHSAALSALRSTVATDTASN